MRVCVREWEWGEACPLHIHTRAFTSTQGRSVRLRIAFWATMVGGLLIVIFMSAVFVGGVYGFGDIHPFEIDRDVSLGQAYGE